VADTDDRLQERAEASLPRKQLILRVLSALLLSLLLYGGLYAFAEYLVYEYGYRNRFYQIATADQGVDYLVILGASRALPLEFGDAHSELEQLAQGPVINLAMPGAGVIPNYLLLDYFLSRHQARGVIYFLDSFAFYSREWNEDRLEDSRLWQRAPLDTALLDSLWRATRALNVDPSVFRNYLSGFSKINDPTTWFQADVWAGEEQFEQTYRPDSWFDQSRLEFLYPESIDWDIFERYLSVFVDLVETLRSIGIPLLVVKAPLRPEFYEQLPQEEAFDEHLARVLQQYEVPLYDFADIGFDSSLFYDPDHLNREGVSLFLEAEFESVLETHFGTE
jgi:hypothetical protein